MKYSLRATAFYTFRTTAFHPNFVLVIPNVFLILLSSFSVGNELHFLRGETVLFSLNYIFVMENLELIIIH